MGCCVSKTRGRGRRWEEGRRPAAAGGGEGPGGALGDAGPGVSAEKARAKDGHGVGGRVSRPARSVEEKSRPRPRWPSKPPRCRQGRSAPRRDRRDRDRGAAVPGGRPRRPRLRGATPAAKRAQDKRRDAAGSASCAQRKPPVPARTPPRAPSPAPTGPAKPHPHGPPKHCASPPTPQAPEQEDTPPGSDGDAAAGEGEGEGEGKESLENPLVSMECFIFL